MARMMGESQRALADKYIATGVTTAADIEHYLQNTEDERYWTVYYSTVSVIAQKPL